MRDSVEVIVNSVAEWDDIAVEPHRFGGWEFRLANVEIGHVHRGGMVDIPFTRAIREQLVAESLAHPHHLLPESGWISFYIRAEADLERALWLLRLSYIQKRLSRTRRNPDQRAALVHDLHAMQPSPALMERVR